MRLIPLKEVHVEGSSSPFKYAEVISAVLINPDTGPGGQPIGFSFDQIEKSLAIKAALKTALDAGATDLKLEEPEYAYFMDRMSKMRWTLVHEVMLGFRDDMTKAEKQDPNSKTT